MNHVTSVWWNKNTGLAKTTFCLRQKAQSSSGMIRNTQSRVSKFKFQKLIVPKIYLNNVVHVRRETPIFLDLKSLLLVVLQPLWWCVVPISIESCKRCCKHIAQHSASNIFKLSFLCSKYPYPHNTYSVMVLFLTMISVP